MPGIDKTRFIRIAEIEELLCGICAAVFVDPMVTKCCEQTYCGDCIREWIRIGRNCPNDDKRLTEKKLSKPPRFLFNMLNKQQLKCEFHENGCLDEIAYVRYKRHIRDCKYNPEAMCDDCGAINGERSEHKCVQILAAKHDCVQNLQTMYEVLEENNKELIDKNANLEIELSNQKKKYAEKRKSICELKHKLNEAKKRAKDGCDSAQTNCRRASQTLSPEPEIGTQTIPEHTIKQETVENAIVNSELLVENKKPNEIPDQLNVYGVVKHSSFETIYDLIEMLKEKVDQIEAYTPLIKEEYRPLIEENKRLNETIQLFERNIDRLSLIERTKLWIKTLELKVSDIYSLQPQNIIKGTPVNFRDFRWNIAAKRNVENSIEYLSVHLECNSESEAEMWSFIASTEMTIEPQYRVQFRDRNIHKQTRVYSNHQNSFGFDKFMRWLTLTDEKYGFVKHNTILLKVYVSIW